MKLKVKYTTEWEWVDSSIHEDGILTTNALLDLNTGILSIEQLDCNCDSLIEEYIIYNHKKYYTYEDSNYEYRISEQDLREIKLKTLLQEL